MLILCRKRLFDVEQRLSNRTVLRVVSFSGLTIVVSSVDLRIVFSLDFVIPFSGRFDQGQEEIFV
jgi:hypothetical protein